MLESNAPTPTAKSLSARRAWIEIYTRLAITLKVTVALRKESVDRNRYLGIEADPLDVALRKESVDRNKIKDNRKPPPRQSLSARRAWIEIILSR